MLPYRDIKQMREDGYDASTIEEAESFNARWDALFASPIGIYLRQEAPRDVEIASGVRLLPIEAIAECVQELVPDKILFDAGYIPIASSVGGNCLAYDPRTSMFYWADRSCVNSTEYLYTPNDYAEMPFSEGNLKKALIFVSDAPVSEFIQRLRSGEYEQQLDALD